MVVALIHNHGLMDGREAVTSLFSTPTYVAMKCDINPCACIVRVKEYIDMPLTSSKTPLVGPWVGMVAIGIFFFFFFFVGERREMHHAR